MSTYAERYFGIGGLGFMTPIGAERPRRIRRRPRSRNHIEVSATRPHYAFGRRPPLRYVGLTPGGGGAQAFPQAPFRPRRFIVPSTVAPGSTVEQILIGNVPMGQGPIPAEVLSEVAVGVGMQGPWVYPGQSIQMLGVPQGVVF